MDLIHNCRHIFCMVLICASFGFAQKQAADNVSIKHIAVIETQMDQDAGDAAGISGGDLREITAVLRREALKNLPRDKYKVVASEAVLAVAKECAAGNCIEEIGRKNIADYVVRGTLGKLRGRYSLIIEMFETGSGSLVAVTPDPVRTNDLDELIDQSPAACAAMYKIFLGTNSQTQQKPPPPVSPPVPAPQQVVYRLSVSANPTVGGKVTREPNKSKINAGTKIVITAVPAKGYTFVGWSEERDGTMLSTDPVIEGVMNRHIELIANFTKAVPPPPVLPPQPKPQQQPQHTLTTATYPVPGGTISQNPAGIRYPSGTKVVVTATPSKGYYFTGWTGALTSPNPKDTVTITGDISLIANFAKVQPPKPSPAQKQTPIPPTQAPTPPVVPPQQTPTPIAQPVPSQQKQAAAPSVQKQASVPEQTKQTTAPARKASAPFAALPDPPPEPQVPKTEQPAPVQTKQSTVPTRKASSPFATLPEPLPPASEAVTQ